MSRIEVQNIFQDLATTLEKNYGPFLEENQEEPVAPVYTIESPGKRTDVRATRDEFWTQILWDAAVLGDIVGNKRTIFESPRNTNSPDLAAIITGAASPHTNEKIYFKDDEQMGQFRELSAQFIIWLRDFNSDLPIQWGNIAEKFDPDIIAGLLSRALENAVQIMADGKNISIEELFEEHVSKALRVYFLSGYTSMAERLKGGYGRGTQSAQDLHMQVTFFDQENDQKSKKNTTVSGYDLVKQLSPLNSICMERCGSPFSSLIHAKLKSLGYKGVRISQVSEKEADRATKILSSKDEIVISFPEPVVIDKIMKTVIFLYEDFEQLNQDISAAYMKKISALGNPLKQKELHDSAILQIKEKHGISKKHSDTLLAFAQELRPTYLLLLEALKEAARLNDMPSVQAIAKKIAQMERIQKKFIPSNDEIGIVALEKEMAQKFDEFVALCQKYNQIHTLMPDSLLSSYATFILDRIKPERLIHTVKSVMSKHFSSFMHFSKMSIDSDGKLCVQQLRLTPVAASERGGAEHEVLGVLKRPEGK